MGQTDARASHFVVSGTSMATLTTATIQVQAVVVRDCILGVLMNGTPHVALDE